MALKRLQFRLWSVAEHSLGVRWLLPLWLLLPGWAHSRAAAAFIARELRHAAVSML